MFCYFLFRTLDEDLGIVEVDDLETNQPVVAQGRQQFLWVDKYAPRHYTELLSEEVGWGQNVVTCRGVIAEIKFHLLLNGKYSQDIPPSTHKCYLAAVW